MPPAGDSAPNDAVTFQVYTAQDISRAPMRSMASIAPAPRKTSIGLRILLGFVGLVIVALTGAAVIAVSTEEPTARPTSAAPKPLESTPVPTAEAPAPTMMSIGDPIDPAPPVAATVTPVATVTAPPPVPTPVVTAKPRRAPAAKDAPSTSATTTLKGLAPPPNPF